MYILSEPKLTWLWGGVIIKTLYNTLFPTMPCQSRLAFLNIMIGLCRFEAAVAAAEKARDLDPGNAEVGMILNNVRLVAKARAQGNDLFKAAKFSDASIAYGEGLKYDPTNSVLHCNRAACWSKLEKWEKAVNDCNEALRIQPNYTKALLRRASSYAKVSNQHEQGCFWFLNVLFH